MSRILEFTPSQEEAVVSRILVLVHQAMDEHLPSAGQANRQFTKTVFSEQSSEKTAAMRLPTDGESAFGSVEDTSPDGRDSAPVQLPPPPVVLPPPPKPAQAKTPKVPAAPKAAKPPAAPEPTAEKSRPTHLDTAMENMQTTLKPDWVTRITLALLIAGLILLGYVLFV